jgi:hypothetical protein
MFTFDVKKFVDRVYSRHQNNQLGARRLEKIRASIYGGRPEEVLDDEVIDAILSVPCHFGNLSITATQVQPLNANNLIDGSVSIVGTNKRLLGANQTAGQVLYQKISDGSYLWYGGLVGGTAEQAGQNGNSLAWLLNSGNAGQFAALQSGGTITLGAGASMTVGTNYFLSATAGDMCLAGDVSSGNLIINLGYALTAANFLINVQNQGTHP